MNKSKPHPLNKQTYSKVDFNAAEEMLSALIEEKEDRLKNYMSRENASSWVINNEKSELAKLYFIHCFYLQHKYGSAFFDCCEIFAQIEEKDNQVNGVILYLKLKKGTKENFVCISYINPAIK